MEVNVKFGNYRARFMASYSRYAHFCSAFQLHDFLLSIYQVDGRFGEREVTINEVPEWFQRAVLVKVAHKLLNELDEKKYALASVHYGTRSAGTYCDRSVNNNWLFESLKANSMDIANTVDEHGNGEHLVEVLLTKESLKAAKSLPIEIPAEFAQPKVKKTISGVTEEQLQAYLASN